MLSYELRFTQSLGIVTKPLTKKHTYVLQLSTRNYNIDRGSQRQAPQRSSLISGGGRHNQPQKNFEESKTNYINDDDDIIPQSTSFASRKRGDKGVFDEKSGNSNTRSNRRRGSGVGDDILYGMGEDSRAKKSDPWKILIEKLDNTKSSKDKFGKNEASFKSQAGNDLPPDQLQCKHFGTCAGCSVQGNFDDVPIIKRARRFFKSENVPVQHNRFDVTKAAAADAARFVMGNNTSSSSSSSTTPPPTTLNRGEFGQWGWRTHVKLAVQPLSRWGGLKFGLFKAGTHEVEPIPNCRVHHPRINEAVEELKMHATDLGIKGYTHAASSDNRGPTGELRYVQMSVERSSGKIQLVLVWNAFTFKDAEQTLPRLVTRLKSNPKLWHSVTVNFQTSESNTIFNYHPKAWKLLWGPPTVREKIGEPIFYMRPQIFRQANLDAFELGILPLVTKNIPKGSVVAELYAGVGVLGLNAVSRANEVVCSDSNEFVDEVFDRCADSLKEEDREKVFFEQLPAEEALEQGQCDDADVLIVDPPRRGLDQGVLDLLLDKHESAQAPNLRRLIYISCGFDALERDSRALIESRKWTIKSADTFTLFPGSDHVETVVVFDRNNKQEEEEGEEDEVENLLSDGKFVEGRGFNGEGNSRDSDKQSDRLGTGLDPRKRRGRKPVANR